MRWSTRVLGLTPWPSSEGEASASTHTSRAKVSVLSSLGPVTILPSSLCSCPCAAYPTPIPDPPPTASCDLTESMLMRTPHVCLPCCPCRQQVFLHRTSHARADDDEGASGARDDDEGASGARASGGREGRRENQPWFAADQHGCTSIHSATPVEKAWPCLPPLYPRPLHRFARAVLSCNSDGPDKLARATVGSCHTSRETCASGCDIRDGGPGMDTETRGGLLTRGGPGTFRTLKRQIESDTWEDSGSTVILLRKSVRPESFHYPFLVKNVNLHSLYKHTHTHTHKRTHTHTHIHTQMQCVCKHRTYLVSVYDI